MSEICSKFLTKKIKKVIHIVLVSLTLVLKSHLILLASLLQKAKSKRQKQPFRWFLENCRSSWPGEKMMLSCDLSGAISVTIKAISKQLLLVEKYIFKQAYCFNKQSSSLYRKLHGIILSGTTFLIKV